jgi:hypothetical protein
LVSAPWKSQAKTNGAYESGFASDLGASISYWPIFVTFLRRRLELFKPHIELSSYAFTGGIEIDENGTFSIAKTSGTDEYTGTPSRHIDESWKRLLAGKNGTA